MSQPPPYGPPGPYPGPAPGPWNGGRPPGAPPPRRRGRLAVVLSLGAVVVVVAVVITGIAVFGLPGGAAGGPHRVPVKGAGPAAGQPRWAQPDHHWVAFDRDWTVARTDGRPQHYGLASDGKHVVAAREPITGQGEPEAPAELTAFDGATGKRLWRVRVPWANGSAPVGAGGVVVVPVGKELDRGTVRPQPVRYVAYDGATGRERWRVRVADRAQTGETTLTTAEAAPGAFYHGVFYYTDGAKLIGVDAATGRRRYQVTGRNHRAVAGPIVVGGRIAVISQGPPDTVSYFRRSAYFFTPDLRHSTSVTFPMHAKPQSLAASGDVLVTWGEGRMWATDVRTGRGLWAKKLPGSPEVAGVLGKTILTVRGESATQRITGLDLLTGRRRWTTAPKDEVSSVNVGIADGTAFAMGHGIAILDTATGKLGSGQETKLAGGLVTAAAGHIVVYNHDGITGFA